MAIIDDLLGFIAKVLFIYFPAMAANGAPVLLRKAPQ